MYRSCAWMRSENRWICYLFFMVEKGFLANRPLYCHEDTCDEIRD